jgi:2-amino-4-hydroxy-6-hydroxymethyldihydropteridine diphosphokinase
MTCRTCSASSDRNWSPLRMTGPTVFGIALGSNLGDRRRHLQQAVQVLLSRIPAARLTAAASLYETEPVDCPTGTQSFLNTVIELSVAMTPAELHKHLLAVESLAGRPLIRDRNAPRTLDLDLLYAGSYQSSDPILTIPHPRLHLRRFVLQPLAEIRPSLCLPGMQGSVSHLLSALPEEAACIRLSGAWCPPHLTVSEASRR